MGFSLMTERDRQDFQREYPDAYAFLQDRVILREYIRLSAELADRYTSKDRRAWIQGRLESLESVAVACGGKPYGERVAELQAGDPPKDV